MLSSEEEKGNAESKKKKKGGGKSAPRRVTYVLPILLVKGEGISTQGDKGSRGDKRSPMVSGTRLDKKRGESSKPTE